MGLQNGALRNGGLRNLSVIAPIPDSGVWRFTFDTADTTGSTTLDAWNDNDGTINGATTGVAGASQTYSTAEAYSFDGTDDYVSQPLQFADGTDISVGAWVKFDNIPSSDRYPVMGIDDANGDIFKFTLDTEFSSDFQFGNFDGSNHLVSDPASNYTAGTWYHVVGTYSSTDGYRLYRNGSEVASNTDTVFTPVDATPDIGASSSQGLYAAADIDDPRHYSKTLTGTEVSNWYNTGSISG